MMRSRIAKNTSAAKGFVKKSARLSAEATKGTTIRPASTNSRMKKWRRSMCLADLLVQLGPHLPGVQTARHPRPPFPQPPGRPGRDHQVGHAATPYYYYYYWDRGLFASYILLKAPLKVSVSQS